MDQGVENTLREFDLGNLIESHPLTGGNANVLKVQTTLGDYVIKRGELERNLRLYHEVEIALNAVGVRQARLYGKPGAGFLSSAGHSVYEFLPGRWKHVPTRAQTAALTRYLSAYNRALATLTVPPFVDEDDNAWKKANSLAFVVSRIPELLSRAAVSSHYDEVGLAVIAYWHQHASALDSLPAQLVHGDIGPGNILYGPRKALSIIDFTAYHEPPLYSLCVTFYWHYFYYSRQPRFDRIADDLAVYASQQAFSDTAKQLFPLIFLKVATRILFVPLLLHLETGIAPVPNEWDKRANIAYTILSNQSRLQHLIIGSSD